MEIKKNQLMGQSELDKIAREIIKNNIYLSLATSDGITPWVAPLFYAIDDIYNFYFISQLDSLHSKHILKNPTVAFAIFDSHHRKEAVTVFKVLEKHICLIKVNYQRR